MNRTIRILILEDVAADVVHINHELRKAVEAVKSGAADYVLKERPADLAPAVQQALREADNSAGRRESDAAL